jgi:hypothetical protein
MSLLAHYTSFRGPAIDLRVGFHQGMLRKFCASAIQPCRGCARLGLP